MLQQSSLGGDVSVQAVLSPNEAAASAARQRQTKREASAGSEESRKKELIGRIDAIYASRKESRPLGLGARSADEIQAHLTALRSGER